MIRPTPDLSLGPGMTMGPIIGIFARQDITLFISRNTEKLVLAELRQCHSRPTVAFIDIHENITRLP